MRYLLNSLIRLIDFCNLGSDLFIIVKVPKPLSRPNVWTQNQHEHNSSWGDPHTLDHKGEMFNKTVYEEWASGDKAHLYSQNVLPWTVTVDGFIGPFHKDIDDQTKRTLFLHRNPVPICQCVDCATAQGGSFWGSGEHQHWVYNLGQLPPPPLTPPPYTYSSIYSTGMYSPGHQSNWCEWRNWQSDRCTFPNSKDQRAQLSVWIALVVKMVLFVLEASTCVIMSVWSRDDLFEFIEELKKY